MAISLQQGANAALPDGARVALSIRWQPERIGGKEVDASAFLLGANGKVRSDADMVFYNQPSGAGGAVTTAAAQGGTQGFTVDLAALPAEVERIALTLTIHDAGSVAFSQAQQVRLTAEGVADYTVDLAGRSESALIIAELYRRAGAWKIRAVGQGFVGGLGPLAMHYGVDIGEEAAAEAAPPPPATPGRISLEKRLVDLEKKDPQLVSLVKKLQVSLEKKPLATDRAKVALCLDISGSMHGLFKSGKIDQLVQRLMALGMRFDDDGRIDVFLFGADDHTYGELDVGSYRGFVAAMQNRHRLEGGTNYGKVMRRIRAHYAGQRDFGRVPVYVMFVTDGGTQDRELSEKMIRESSAEAIFWQFMAIGRYDGPAKKKGFFARILPSGFDFLAELDNLSGRTIDNANFFAVEDPTQPSDEELFDLLMAEYPDWLKKAQAAGVLKI